MKKTFTLLLCSLIATAAFSQLNMQLLDQIDYTPNANDIWGWVDPDNGKEYALVGLVTGVSVVDVSNPSNVVEVQFIPGASSSWRDIKTWGHYAYVTNESSGGVMVINLDGAPNNITWSNWTPNIPGLGSLNRCHNLYIDENGYCYLAGCNLNNGGMLFVDVFSTPGSPLYVGKGPNVYAHDVYVRNNIMYSSEINQGRLGIYNVVDKQNAVLLATQQTPNNFTHNAWLNDAGDVVFTTDEKANAFVAAYDISDLGDIQELDRFRPIETLGAGVIPHNVHVWNDWLIISYYTDGGIIVDASRPENLIEVGNWDTFLGGGGGFSGVWGAYPFLPSGIVLLTDIGTGLYVCGADYVRACWLEGKVTNAITGVPIAGAAIAIDSPQANAASTNLSGDYQTGQAIPGVFDVTVTATGYLPKTVQANLENGVLTILDVQLEPEFLPNFPQISSAATAGCQPFTATFSETSGLVASWSWTFEGGTPATSNEQFPVVVFNDPGTYNVALDVVTLGGNAYSIENQDFITVAPAPVASFIPITDSLEVTFANASEFFNTVHWDFGDGATSTAIDPAHAYATPGVYEVTLTLTGDCGTAVLEQEVVVGPFQPTAGFVANAVQGCAPLTVQFTDTSTGFPESWEWAFPGGIPATSTEQHPIVTYPDGGSFDVQLTVTTGAGSDQSTQLGLVTVGTGPTPDFDFMVNGPVVHFTNNSLDSESQSWDFGDGTTSTEAGPTHLFQMPGTYTVVLTTSNACGTATYSQEVTITAFQPNAGFSADIVEGCAPLTVAFSDETLGEPDTWEWSFPGGVPASSSEQHPVVVYNSPGTYSVTLVATNALGSDATTLLGYITVKDVPTAGFTYSNTGPTVVFTNTSSNAGAYVWEYNDGTGAWSIADNPTYTFPGTGNYDVTLYAANECGTVSVTETVVIGAVQPTAGFSASASQGCSPFTVQYFDTSLGEPTAWEWSFPGGDPAISNEQNPVVVYHTAGTYPVNLTVTNAAGASQATATDFVVIEDQPQAAFTFSINGAEVLFTNTTINGSSYFWSFGNGSTSTAENPSVEYAANGIYQVTLAVSNDCGTSLFATEVVIEAFAPIAGFSAGTTVGCAPQEVQFTDESTNGPDAWEWTFAGGNPSTSDAQHPTVVYDVPGVYAVTLTVTNGAGSNTLTQSDLVVVEDVPSAGFTFSIVDQTVDFTNTSINAFSYEWDFGDNAGFSMEENPSYAYTEPGEYEVTLTATNACGAEVITQSLVIEANAASLLSAYQYSLTAAPNPFSGQLIIHYYFNNNNERATIYVNNILGEEIAKVPVNTGAGSIKLDQEFQQGGVYFIRLVVGNKSSRAIKIVRIKTN